MTNQPEWDASFFHDLRALAESAFPKHCPSCGRRFATAGEFLQATMPISAAKSGLKQAYDEDDRPIVELFRNCPCGSTLMDYFTDRRDQSEAGVRRRKRFGALLDFLVSQGVERQLARVELIKVLRGQNSELLARFKPPGRQKG